MKDEKLFEIQNYADSLRLSNCKCNQFKEEIVQSHGISRILQRFHVTYQDIFQDQYCQKIQKLLTSEKSPSP